MLEENLHWVKGLQTDKQTGNILPLETVREATS